MNIEIWEDKKVLEELEEKRDKVREIQPRLTYDCFNLTYTGKPICSEGYPITISLMGVLEGLLDQSCIDCPYFKS